MTLYPWGPYVGHAGSGPHSDLGKAGQGDLRAGLALVGIPGHLLRLTSLATLLAGSLTLSYSHVVSNTCADV